MDCELCKAVDEDYRVVYRDEYVVVVTNYEPLKQGHVMVMPIRHAEQMSDLTADEAYAFLQAADRSMWAITKLCADPPLYVVNGWQHRSQPHLHAHVVPSKMHLRSLLQTAEGVDERKRVDEVTLQHMTDDVKKFYF